MLSYCSRSRLPSHSNRTHYFRSSPLPLFRTQLESPDVTVTSHKIYRYYLSIAVTTLLGRLHKYYYHIKHTVCAPYRYKHMPQTTEWVSRSPEWNRSIWDQVTQKMRYCGPLYSSVLCIWTWVDHRGYKYTHVGICKYITSLTHLCVLDYMLRPQLWTILFFILFT